MEFSIADLDRFPPHAVAVEIYGEVTYQKKLLAQVVGYALSHENSPDLQAVIMDADTELFEVTDSESDRTLRPFADALWNAACTKDTKQRLAEAYAELVESRREYARDRQLAERYHVNI